ncbi:PucR family transcriptional regulator [Nonomuraea sp. NPDC048826]|uniref:PucR family transcriptional regulator n=1 Tax=Nonomuraea sp. NPDC048826 TaxID=3364347 RepID=UPI0037207DC0
MSDHVPGFDLEDIAARASADAGGVPARWLGEYLPLLAEVSRTLGHLGGAALARMRECGETAARDGIPLRAVIDVHLSATWLAWPVLPGIVGARRAQELRSAGEAIFRAADRSVGALVEGYEAAQRLEIRREEAVRREFVDDLLQGSGDRGAVAERAARFGLRLAAAHLVCVARTDRPFQDAGPVARHVEAALLSAFGAGDILVATKDGLLVCVAPPRASGVSEAFATRVRQALGPGAPLRVGVGRAHEGPGGVARSFDEARSVVALGRRLELEQEVLYASELLVLQVLLRDEAAIRELVEAVLGPLRAARGGPATLLETLFAYFASGGVATATATRLHVGVRTVTYRLDRIQRLTGYDLSRPIQRHALETATLGARLLGWPET